MKKILFFGFIVGIALAFSPGNFDKYDYNAPNGYYKTEEDFKNRNLSTDIKLSHFGTNTIFDSKKKRRFCKSLGWYGFAFDNQDFFIVNNNINIVMNNEGKIKVIGSGPEKMLNGNGEYAWMCTDLMLKKEGVNNGEWDGKFDLTEYFSDYPELLEDWKKNRIKIGQVSAVLPQKIEYINKYNAYFAKKK
ncbi:MAG TPA: hypothetical protein VK177_15590 [Flavobacteriales bacterium]|nr:hypothetical protein [Flavobacteriales bacterium]